MELIHCLPTSLCSYDYQLNGGRDCASINYDWLTEQGEISVNGIPYRIVKHGPLSGRWTFEDGTRALIAGQKLNAFTRTFELSVPGGTEHFKLQAESAFGRTMLLSGSGQRCVFRPDHAFTRRAKITGNWDSFELVAFAFWLVGLTWKRAQESSNSSSSSAGASG